MDGTGAAVVVCNTPPHCHRPHALSLTHSRTPTCILAQSRAFSHNHVRSIAQSRAFYCTTTCILAHPPAFSHNHMHSLAQSRALYCTTTCILAQSRALSQNHAYSNNHACSRTTTCILSHNHLHSRTESRILAQSRMF